MKYLCLVFSLSFLISCNQSVDDHKVLLAGHGGINAEDSRSENHNALEDKWYQGKAEVSTFTLKQNRYKNINDGEVVQIFVTEDFLTDRHVKNDNYTNPNSTAILKNNRVRKFTTGIYDYSMYTSVFTDLNKKKKQTLKATMSSQDWCGQSFTQLNLKNNKFKLKGFSYFENEGDKKADIENELLLDEVFNIIRINPELLPIGDTKVIPSMIFSRLKHKELKAYDAHSLLKGYDGDLVSDKNLMHYLITIPELKAEFGFVFRQDGTHEIMCWTEKYPSVFDGKLRETTAVRKAVQWLPYWQNNSVEDEVLRNNLLLGLN